ncbi:hypothetical protein [Nocardia abscessus]|uniref:hypothetical protein n=1 Tax=Nocardia abscessus TaxID=120957 RepID=UPI002454E75B|nr:hypothetical protein [Nocardia abscessus]
MDHSGDIAQSGDGLLVAVTGPVSGNVTAISGAESFRLEAFPHDSPVSAVDVGGVSLSVLLRGTARVVPFIGRVAELSHLSSWRDAPSRLSVMLVFGPGGKGKTRLAAKFVDDASAAGWMVAQARHHSDPQTAQPTVGAAQSREARVLIVVDYAERWPRLDLERLLQHRLVQDARQVRILLLARPAGYWWKALANPLLKLGATVSELRLGPLADTRMTWTSPFDFSTSSKRFPRRSGADPFDNRLQAHSTSECFPLSWI